jgi:desulfoferrodoxin (superoxide reductase-like protein)
MKKRPKTMPKGNAVGITNRVAVISAALFVLLSTMPVVAHAPASMTLDYNWDTQTLSVTISHSVSDPNSHYIQTIIIYKNDAMVHTESYTSQDSTSGGSDTFNIATVDGDVLRVWANCSISGFIEETITVSESGTTPTTAPPPPPGINSTTIILVVVVVLGLIFVLFAIMRRR